MNASRSRCYFPGFLLAPALALLCGPGAAGELVVELGKSQGVTLVGAVDRWDADGNPRRPVDPKAKIDAPMLAARAKQASGGRWVFADLPPGRYDLVILARDKVRVEGFHYPPVLEFDPFLPPDGEAPEKAAAWIAKHIAGGRYYENKVAPLFMAGDEKQVRVFMQLLRDEPTSFDAQFGARVATLRHEVWQYTFRYGGWAKEKSTRVLDRILMARDDLRTWTWVWEPRLGGIRVTDEPRTVTYELPGKFDPETAEGLLPY